MVQRDSATEPDLRGREESPAAALRVDRVREVVDLGLYPIATFEKQRLNLIGNLV